MKGPGMNLFSSRKKFNVSERDPTYKVRYLGNIQTSMMRGEGCTDKAAGILWSNFLKNGGGLDMKLTICATGLKAVTKEQGLTDYRAHRISYCIAHPEYPKLFLWVYRHEGKRMKVELRCHAVLLRKVEKARAMALQLHEKLSSALSEFVREKTRRQNTRLTLQRTNSLPSSTGDSAGHQPLRRKMLSTAQNFKPSVDRSASAPKLGAISEDCEPEPDILEEEEEDEEEEEVDDELMTMTRLSRQSRDDSCLSAHSDGDLDLRPMHVAFPDMDDAIFDLEMGNDVTALQADADVQFTIHQSQLSSEDEDDGSESGFSEQDASGSTGSSGSCASENGHMLDCEVDEGMGSLCFLPSPGGLDSEPVIFASAL